MRLATRNKHNSKEDPDELNVDDFKGEGTGQNEGEEDVSILLIIILITILHNFLKSKSPITFCLRSNTNFLAFLNRDRQFWKRNALSNSVMTILC